MAHGKRMAKTRCDNVGVFSAGFADGVGALGTVLAVDFDGALACLGCDNASVVMAVLRLDGEDLRREPPVVALWPTAFG